MGNNKPKGIEKTVILHTHSGRVAAVGYDLRYGEDLTISDSYGCLDFDSCNHGLPEVATMARKIAAVCIEFADECDRRDKQPKE